MQQQVEHQTQEPAHFESFRDTNIINESPLVHAPQQQESAPVGPKKTSPLQLNSHRQQQQSPRMLRNTSPGLLLKPSPKGNLQQSHLMNPVLDREERDLINLSANLSKEEIWEKLEQKRFQQLKRAAVNLQSELIFNNRCPKCTLVPPCKHYERAEQIIQEGTQIVQQMKPHLSPKKREGLMKAIKDQQRSLNASIVGDGNNAAGLESYRSNDIHQISRVQASQEEQIDPFSNKRNSGTNQGQQNVFITGADPAVTQTPDGIQKLSSKQLRGLPRNGFNNTVIGNRGAFRAHSESKPFYSNDQRSNLSQYGSNIINQQSKRQYLRKRDGNGGSPVPLEELQSSRDKTTVRIRTKNNQFVFQEATFSQPLNGRVGNQTNVQNHSYVNETSQQSLQERERLQALIAKYREDKIQRQIERIEQERMMMEFEKKMEKDKDYKRRQYNEQLKQKLQDYSQYKAQIEEEKAMEQRMEEQRSRARFNMKRQYMDTQKKYIAEYREQKRRTDQLLMIPQQENGTSDANQQAFYNQFPKKQFMNENGYYSSGGVVSGAGQQLVSGSGQVQKQTLQGNIPIVQMFQQPKGSPNNQAQQQEQSAAREGGFEEDDYDQYYGEVDQDDLMSHNPQQEMRHKLKQTSQGVIGMHKNKEGAVGTSSIIEKNNDSLDLVGHE